MMNKSLASRIIIMSSAWVILALLITGLFLVFVLSEHTAKHYDKHVALHLEELVAASGLEPDGAFKLDFEPSDPRYQIIHSGWYWEVKQSGVTLNRSQSLEEGTLDLGDLRATTQPQIGEIAGPLEETLRVHFVSLELDPGQSPYILFSTAPMTGITDDVAGFTRHITMTFLVLGMGLLLAVVIQVRVALKPLQAISTGIADVRAGRAPKLPGVYPDDVQPLVEELNNLLEHNAVLLKRARNRLGDLAHSVKNPLSVINNEARNMDAGQRDLVLRQTSDITDSVDYYLARARAFGTGNVMGSRSNIKAVVDDLMYAMQRIYQERNLNYDFIQQEDNWFRGEGQDLEEMVGNLLDNACKWATSRVVIECKADHERLVLLVEDDGPGIPEEKIEEVMLRGRRLDETKPGHGQGLGIVKDIADLYGGFLTLGRSELGGLRVKLILQAA